MNAHDMKSRWSSAIAVSLAVLAGLFAAPSARANPPDRVWQDARVVEQEILEQGNDGIYTSPLAVLITGAMQWDNTMDSLERAGGLAVTPGPGAAPAGIQWSRQSVLFITLGAFPTRQCSIVSCELRRIGHRALCHVVMEQVPELRIQVPSCPYYVSGIDRRGGITSIEFSYEIREAVSFTGALAPAKADDGARATTENGAPRRDIAWGGLKNLFH